LAQPILAKHRSGICGVPPKIARRLGKMGLLPKPAAVACGRTMPASTPIRYDPYDRHTTIARDASHFPRRRTGGG
jgi:hypothetical protein